MDNNFENKIKQTLEAHPDYPVNIEMFDSITKKIDNMGVVPKSIFSNWLYPFIGGLLLSGILSYTYFHSDNDYNKTDQNIADHNYTEHNRQVIIDTTYTYHTVVSYDTIYHQVVLNQGFNSTQNTAFDHQNNRNYPFKNRSGLVPSKSHNDQNPSFDYYQAFYNKYSNSFMNSSGSLRSTSNREGQNGQRNSHIIKPPIDRSILSNIALLNSVGINSIDYYSPRVVLVQNRFWEILKRKEKPHGIAGLVAGIGTFLSPIGYAINLNAGYIHPLNLQHPKENFQFDLGVDINLDHNWSIAMGISNLSYGFESMFDNVDVTTLTDYPILAHINGGDLLTRISAEFKVLQIPIGIKYQFRKKDRIRPMISLGTISQVPIKSSMEYYFEGSFPYERKLNSVLKYKGLFSDYWASIGLTYQYNSKFGLELSSGYQGSFRKGTYNFENNQFLSFKAGLKYDL